MAVLILNYKKGYRRNDGKWEESRSLVICDICQTQREVRKSSVNQGCGIEFCIKCAAIIRGRNRANTEIKYEKLAELKRLKILIIGINSQADSTWQCVICDFTFKSSYRSMEHHHGCPNCRGLITTKQDYINLGKSRQIEFIGHVPAYKSYLTQWKCQCGVVFDRSFRSVKASQRSGCSKCGRLFTSGKNHYLYDSTLTPEDRIKKRTEGPQYTFWVKQIYKKFNYTCQKCRKRGGNLNAHHIFNWKDYPELRYDINNGICLCQQCHLKFHTLYGKRFNNHQQLNKFLSFESN